MLGDDGTCQERPGYTKRPPGLASLVVVDLLRADGLSPQIMPGMESALNRALWIFPLTVGTLQK
ncbi:hypothetical protein PILCRDRAFT_818454 [Piloderma croceum F 1598]|uniref:Uncharacterized protein n=1 Tax=Piloderma croceum (strain F 1598) TaxID=765440 RepID=A0A0C3G0G8_PILCF|nr:hypothetical protein PILCRDRAFT_818454 [Piloderma croceum F 1598]